MKRGLFLLVLCLAVVVGVAAQERDSQGNWWPMEANSIMHLLMDRPPQLQAGFSADDDKWLLYSPQFDALSAASQAALLRKYGYGPARVWAAGERRAGALNRREGIAILAPGVNVKVTTRDAEFGPRLQSETSIAVSGQNLVVGYNDLPLSPVSYSRDGGSTWHESSLPTYPGALFANAGDPVVAAGPGNRFYHAYLAFNAVGRFTVAVARSDDGGASWSAPTNASASITGLKGGSPDKEWMTVDNTSGSPYRGNVYVSWTQFGMNTSSIRFVRSTDGGQTWSPAAAVAELSREETQARQVLQGSYIATGPGGEVYVAWYDSRVGGIRLRKSVDGGVTFSDPVTALTPVGFSFSVFLTGQFDVPAFPQLAVDTSSGPNRGTVYLTANVLTSSGNLDVVLARSTDGGATWSAPFRVNNDSTSTDQFMPAIAVAENGNVGVAFYDRRNDPENNSLVDLYLAISSDGGRTFPINQRVTTTNWPVLPTAFGFRPGYHGDYNQVVASGNNFHVAWGDDRSGQDPDVYVAVVPATGNVPDFVLAATKSWADVLPGGSVQYTFTTGGTSGVTLSARSSAPGLSFQLAGSTLTVNTAATTAPGTYTITVRGSSAGIERATVVRLTVHSAALRQLPVAITGIREPAYVAHAFADGAGNVHLITARDTESRVRKRLSYVRIPAIGRPAEAPQTVLRADTAFREQALLEPRVGADSSGRVYVVWRRSDRNGSHILLSRSTDGRTFSDPVVVSRAAVPTTPGGVPTTSAFQPALAVGLSGAVFVAYMQQTIRQIAPDMFALVALDLFLTRSTDGGATFSEPVNVSRYNSAVPTLVTSSPPSLALDTADNPYLAWAAVGVPGPTGRPQDVFYARSRDAGRTFEPLVNVSRGFDPGFAPRQPSLVVDTRNNIYVAFNNVDFNFGQGDILLAKSTDGARFETVSNVSFATYWTGSVTDWPAMGVDGNGILTVAWRQWLTDPLKNNDTQRDIFYSRSTDGGLSWSDPVNLSTNLGDTLLGGAFAFAQPPALTVDNDGRVYIFWDDDTSGGVQIWMATLP